MSCKPNPIFYHELRPGNVICVLRYRSNTLQPGTQPHSCRPKILYLSFAAPSLNPHWDLMLLKIIYKQGQIL